MGKEGVSPWSKAATQWAYLSFGLGEEAYVVKAKCWNNEV